MSEEVFFQSSLEGMQNPKREEGYSKAASAARGAPRPTYMWEV